MSQKKREPDNRPSAKRPPRPAGNVLPERNTNRQRVTARNQPVQNRAVPSPASQRRPGRNPAEHNHPAPGSSAAKQSVPLRNSPPAHPNVQMLSDRDIPHNKKISSADRVEHMRATQRKRTITSALFLSVIVILIMVVTAAAILYVTDYVAAKPNYSFVSNGTIEHSIGATALIIRDEKTFTSTAEGSLVALALEGSRVCKEQELAMIIPADLDSTSASLRNIQQQIVDAQRALMDKGKGSGADTICLEADNEILPIVNMIRTDSLTDRLSNLMSYSSSVQVLMDKRDSDLQSIDFQDEQLSALIVSKNDYENVLSAQADTLIADIPGIVSYKLDGFESTLNSGAVASLTQEQYDEYVQKSKGILSNDLDVKKDEAALRICQNAEQYLVTLVPDCSVTDFPTDSTCDIRVPSEGVVISDCKVIRSMQGVGGVFLVFQTTSQVERLLDRRTAEIEIIQSSTVGLRVPASSLIDADYETGFADIFYNKSGYARKLKVVIVDHDREYAIIAPVEGFDVPNLSTIIITNPRTISENDKVE